MDLYHKQRRAGSQPDMRSACAPCHERKVRCIVSDVGGPCDNCQSRKLECFYLPRFKSGRRPIGNTSLHSESSFTHSTHANSDDSHPSSAQLRRGRHKPSDVTITGDHNDDFDWNWTSPARHQAHATKLPELDMTVSGFHATNDFNLHSSVTAVDFPHLANGGYQDMEPAGPSPLLVLDMPLSTTASQFPSDAIDTTNTELGQKDFAMLLEYCRKLQSHISRTMDNGSTSAASESPATTLASTVSITQLQEMLRDVDTSCDAIFAIYGQGIFSKPAAQLEGELDHASASLTNALILKAFQVCDLVFSCNLLQSHRLDDMLLHKRLDFNITQARIVLSKIQELTQMGVLTSKKIGMNASYIEEKFKSIK